MEAKHWGLRKSRNATSLNSRFKSLDTRKVKIISRTVRGVRRTNRKKASKFFFSSRRRHTRWTGDWRSDVCSSDPWFVLALHGCCPSLLFHGLHFFYDTFVRARKNRLDFADLRSQLQLAPLQLRQLEIRDLAQSQLRPDARARVRYHRVRQRGHHPQGLGAGVKYRSQPRSAHFILLFAQRPRLVLHQVFVHRSYQGPRRLQRARELKIVEMRTEFVNRTPGDVRYLIICRLARLGGRGIRHLATEVARNHGQGAAGQVAQVVSQVGVVALHQSVEGKRAVLPEYDFPQQEIAQGVAAHSFHDGFGAHHVAAGLRHLVVLEEQPAVCHNRFRQGQAGSHQKRRPIDAVEAHDFLANHVHVGRPVTLEALLVGGIGRAEANGGTVVAERVQPHVDHVPAVVRHRHAPAEGAARHRKVAQTGAHERRHLVASRLRTYEIRLIAVQLQQLFLKSRELEKVIFLAHRFCGPSALWARRSRTGGIHVEFVENAILPGVLALVDETVVAQAAEHLLYAALVLRVCGADELVVAQPQQLPELAEAGGNLVRPLLRRLACGLRGALHVYPMLV